MHLGPCILVILQRSVAFLVFGHKLVEIANNGLGHVAILLGGSLQGNMDNTSPFYFWLMNSISLDNFFAI